MADSKVTELTSATSANPADVVYLVQGSNDRKLTIATLFSAINTPLKTGGVVALGGTPQVLLGSGTINATTVTTLLDNTGPSDLTLAAGTLQGQIKIVIMRDYNGIAVIESSPINEQITFDLQDQAVLLVWIGTKWYILGGTATIAF